MTCREFAEFMQDYLTDDLSAHVHAGFVRHLSRCLNCVEFLRQYELAIRAARMAFTTSRPSAPRGWH